MSDLTLSLEGSTYAGSVAVIDGRNVIAERQLADVPKPGRSGRDELFMPMVADCLRDGKVAPRDLARVVCGAGPGSFTSLRIAASVAKGFAVGLEIPLFAVSSLMLVVAADVVPPGKWMAVLPAMRGEVFASLFEIGEDGEITESGNPQLLDDAALAREVAHTEMGLIGPAVARRQSPHARGVARVLDVIIGRGPCDIATWEPVYGRLAEAQAKWETAHGRPLTAAG